MTPNPTVLDSLIRVNTKKTFKYSDHVPPAAAVVLQLM